MTQLINPRLGIKFMITVLVGTFSLTGYASGQHTIQAYVISTTAPGTSIDKVRTFQSYTSCVQFYKLTGIANPTCDQVSLPNSSHHESCWDKFWGSQGCAWWKHM